MGDEQIQVVMRTPSGKVVPFAVWVRTLDKDHLRNDIRKMLLEINNAMEKLVRRSDDVARAALEQTYYMLLVLVADTTKPIPVKNEVDGNAEKKA